MVKVGAYELTIEIGRGTFSRVRLAHRITNPAERYVAKIVSRSHQNVDNDVRREIGILRRVQHENVVKLVEILESPNNYYIILEPVLGGDLCDYIIKKHPRGLPLEEASRLYSQLLGGVAMCHGVGVAHRDLKPENILMTTDERPIVKISDFGLSRLHRHSQHVAKPYEYAETVAGTPAYLAPEVFQCHYDAFRADMWSLGCILYVMCTGRFPFGSATGPQLERRIMEASYDDIPAHVDPMAADVIRRLLQRDPAMRMTLPELAGHPFLKSNDEQYTAVVDDDVNLSFASPPRGSDMFRAVAEDSSSPRTTSPEAHSPTKSPPSSSSPSHASRRIALKNRLAAMDYESDEDPPPPVAE